MIAALAHNLLRWMEVLRLAGRTIRGARTTQMIKILMIAIVASAALGSTAVAAGLITSEQIKDFTILVRDMATGSVSSRVIGP